MSDHPPSRPLRLLLAVCAALLVAGTLAPPRQERNDSRPHQATVRALVARTAFSRPAVDGPPPLVPLPADAHPLVPDDFFASAPGQAARGPVRARRRAAFTARSRAPPPRLTHSAAQRVPLRPYRPDA